MPAPMVQINYDLMQTIDQRFQKINQQAETTYTALNTIMESLKAGQWQGSAAVACFNEFDASITPAFKQLITVLQTASTSVLSISKIFLTAEEEAASLFKFNSAALPTSVHSEELLSSQTQSQLNPIHSLQQGNQNQPPPILTVDPTHNFNGLVTDPQPTNTTELFDLVNRRYREPGKPVDSQTGPIGITKIGDNRYLVTLVGVEYDSPTEANNQRNAIYDQIDLTDSDYTDIVRNTIRANVPAGAELVFAGHSQGGIVSQKLAADSDFNKGQGRSLWEFITSDDQADEYIVTDVITYGAPVTTSPVDNVTYRMYVVDHDPIVLSGGIHREAFADMVRQDSYIHLPNPVSEQQMQQDSSSPHYPWAYTQSLTAMQEPAYQQAYIDQQWIGHQGFYEHGYSIHELPFQVDQWGETYTFAAETEHADQVLVPVMPQ